MIQQLELVSSRLAPTYPLRSQCRKNILQVNGLDTSRFVIPISYITIQAPLLDLVSILERICWNMMPERIITGLAATSTRFCT